MKTFKEKNPLQLFFLITCFSVLIFYFTVSYTDLFSTVRGNALWKEKLFIPFYFTTISNVLIFVLFSFKVFSQENFLQKKSFKFFEIISISNITLTMAVYWALLAKDHLPSLFEQRKVLIIISTFLVHLLIPLIALINFTYELFYLKSKTKIKGNAFVLTSWTLLFPFCWLIMGLVFYFSLGAKLEDAFYDFIDILHRPWWKTVIYFFVIHGFYYCFSFLFIYLNNRFAK